MLSSLRGKSSYTLASDVKKSTGASLHTAGMKSCAAAEEILSWNRKQKRRRSAPWNTQTEHLRVYESDECKSVIGINLDGEKQKMQQSSKTGGVYKRWGKISCRFLKKRWKQVFQKRMEADTEWIHWMNKDLILHLVENTVSFSAVSAFPDA